MIGDRNAMGDIVESPEISNNKETAGGPLPALQVSVSFGRYENDDSLSWERWSSFPSNRYLAEVEKCSTPGSVASKKAYFEAHYKKIAARRAELLDQEKQMIASSIGVLLKEQNLGDLSMRPNTNFGCEGECDAAEQDTDEAFKASDAVEKPNRDVVVTKGCQSFKLVEIDNEELDKGVEGLNLKGSDEFDLLKEEIHSDGSPVTEPPWHVEVEMPSTPKAESEKVRRDPPKASPKKVKKKSVSAMPKSPQISVSALRVSKPVSSPTAVSASQSSARKGGGSPLPQTNTSSTHERMKAVHRNLQRPLNSGCASCAASGSLKSTRKSVNMERTGDEMVRGAFRTFQNDFSQRKISGEERSSATKKVSTKVAEPRVSTSRHLQNENERYFKVGASQSNKGRTSPYVLRLDVRAEKRKEFFRKIEEKSKAREVEEQLYRSKLKEKQTAELKKLRESLNFKARPMPDFYQRSKSSKLDKESKHNLHS